MCTTKNCQQRVLSEMADFPLGKGECTTAPLPQPCEAAHTVAYMKGYAEEGDSASVPSPNTVMTSNLRGCRGNNNR